MNNDRIYDLLLRIVESESEVDSYLFKVFKITPEAFGNWPRIARVYRHLSFLPFIISKYLFFIFYFFWPILISPLYNLYLLFVLTLHKINLNFRNDAHKNADFNAADLTIALGYSERAYYLIEEVLRSPENTELRISIDCWISMPWVASSTKPDKLSEVDLLSLVTFFDLLRIYIQSILFNFKILSSKHRAHLLQSYCTFQILVCYHGLRKIRPRNVFIAEHFDRFALLTDYINSAYWKSVFCIVQHGEVDGLITQSGDGKITSKIRIPNRLVSVGRLYAYNEVSTKFFRDILFSNGTEVKYLIYRNRLKLTKIIGEDVFRVLIVGNPVSESFHIALYNEIIRVFGNKVFVFYKPHPKLFQNKNINKFGWKLLDNPDVFPVVDLVVSYPSTLATEYQNEKITLINHPIDADPKVHAHLIAEVIREISKRNK